MGLERKLPVSRFTMLQTVCLAALASLATAVPAPEADPLLYTAHPLTYTVPYVTYHVPDCKTEVEDVKGQQCVTKPVTDCTDVEGPSHKREADPQIYLETGVLPYPSCANTVAEH